MNNHPSIHGAFDDLLERILEPMNDDELIAYHEDLAKLKTCVFNENFKIEITQEEKEMLK